MSAGCAKGDTDGGVDGGADGGFKGRIAGGDGEGKDGDDNTAGGALGADAVCNSGLAVAGAVGSQRPAVTRNGRSGAVTELGSSVKLYIRNLGDIY